MSQSFLILPELDFRVAPRACRPNMSMTATALRTTSRPRRGLLLARLVACPVSGIAFSLGRTGACIHSLIVASPADSARKVGLSGQAASVSRGAGVD